MLRWHTFDDIEVNVTNTCSFQSICFGSQEGWYSDDPKHVNQDEMCLLSAFGGEKESMLLGIFDGHGKSGEKASEAARIAVPKYLADLRASKKLPNHGSSSETVPEQKGFIVRLRITEFVVTYVQPPVFLSHSHL